MMVAECEWVCTALTGPVREQISSGRDNKFNGKRILFVAPLLSLRPR